MLGFSRAVAQLRAESRAAIAAAAAVAPLASPQSTTIRIWRPPVPLPSASTREIESDLEAEKKIFKEMFDFNLDLT